MEQENINPIKDISLQCVIFRIDFETDFLIIDKKGYIASEMRTSALFDEIKFAVNGLSVSCIKRDPYSVISFAPNNINGRFEGSFLHIENLNKILKLVNDMFKNLKLLTKNIKRFGVRYFFLMEEKDFSVANNKYLTLFSDKFISSLKNNSQKIDNIFDTALSVKYEKNNYKCRIFTGPLDTNEYKMVFEMPQLVDSENSSHIDFDYYVSEYNFNNLRVDKFIEDSYKEALNVSKSIFLRLE